MFEYSDGGERRVSVTRVVAAPATAIFDLLADPSQHPLLDGSTSVIAVRSAPRRLSAGARFSMKMNLGVRYSITNTVVEFEEGRRLAWRHGSGHRWVWQLEPDGDERTVVTESFDWSTAHTPRLIELLGFPRRNAAGMQATLERLESLVAIGSSRT